MVVQQDTARSPMGRTLTESLRRLDDMHLLAETLHNQYMCQS